MYLKQKGLKISGSKAAHAAGWTLVEDEESSNSCEDDTNSSDSDDSSDASESSDSDDSLSDSSRRVEQSFEVMLVSVVLEEELQQVKRINGGKLFSRKGPRGEGS